MPNATDEAMIESDDVKRACEVLVAALPRHNASLVITHNDHKTVYETVEQYTEPWGDDWVSQEERERAIAANELWELHWYPDTPIGSYKLLASSLWALIGHFLANAGDYR